jgi:hypothetical protein
VKDGQQAVTRSQHGTRSRYVMGCRCERCRVANRVTIRGYRRTGRYVAEVHDEFEATRLAGGKVVDLWEATRLAGRRGSE